MTKDVCIKVPLYDGEGESEGEKQVFNWFVILMFWFLSSAAGTVVGSSRDLVCSLSETVLKNK